MSGTSPALPEEQVMRRGLVCVCTAALMLGCSSSGGSTPGSSNGAGGGAGSGGGGPSEPPLAAGLRISEIAIYQGVKVPLFKDGAEVAQRNAPVVIGRPALVRVFVTPDPEWEPREVSVRLHVSNASGAQPIQAIPRLVDAPSAEDPMGAAFTFDVPGEQLTGDASYSVDIRDSQPDKPGSTNGAVWPELGEASFRAEDSFGPLSLVLVPFRYDADGSGRLPDLGEGQLKKFTDLMFGTYPVPALDLQIHAPIPWTTPVVKSGQGFGSVLQATLRLRIQEAAPTNVYYYGVIAPANSLIEFCGVGACVAGVGSLPASPDDVFRRGSMGLSFVNDQQAPLTFVHEIGHAHGRAHAPCTPPGVPLRAVDSAYPYAQGFTGIWGNDLTAGTLKDPARHHDLMSYCPPYWVSDYTFNALFQRIVALNQNARWLPPTGPEVRYRIVVIEPDGTMVRGGSVVLRSAPQGDRRPLELLGEGGVVIGSVTGSFYGYSNMNGGLLLVPEPRENIASLRFAGARAVRLHEGAPETRD